MRSVLFPGLDSLVGLAQHGVDVKPTLLRVLTDLYVQKPTHSHDEERQFVELALRLIDAVDDETRGAVARRLSTYSNAPPEILSRIAAEPSAISAPQKPNASSLARKPQPKSEAISPAAQRAAALSKEFFAASSEERLRLLAEFDLRAPPALAEPPTFSPETIHALETSALSGRPSDFIRELERALGITRSFAEMIVNDRSGEPLVIAAKALAMPIEILQRILLFVNPSVGHSVRRVYALTDLYKAISPHAAHVLAAAWRDATPATAAAPLTSHAAEARLRLQPGRLARDQEFRARDFTPGSGSAAASRRPSSAHDTIKKMAT